MGRRGAGSEIFLPLASPETGLARSRMYNMCQADRLRGADSGVRLAGPWYGAAARVAVTTDGSS